VGLFRPYERREDSASKPASTEPANQVPPAAKKKVPTPTRKEAEAARRERLNPTLSPADQRKRDRASKAKSREQQWTKVDEEPGRILLRDFIDSRKGMAQWWMPVIITGLALALIVMYILPEAAVWATFVPYLALAAMAVHIFFLWRQYKVLHAERLPNLPMRGLLIYLVNRIISLRRFRMPLPRVNPGDEI
jgi:hypothetical protein